MKNPPLGKRRQRRTGMSPWARHNKREYVYSSAYQQWAIEYRPRKLSQGKSHDHSQMALAA